MTRAISHLSFSFRQLFRPREYVTVNTEKNEKTRVTHFLNISYPFYTFTLFIRSLHSVYPFTSFICFIHWFNLLVLFMGSIHWFFSSAVFIHSIHLSTSFIHPFNPSTFNQSNMESLGLPELTLIVTAVQEVESSGNSSPSSLMSLPGF